MAKIYLLFLFILSFVNAQDFRKDTIQLNETILYDKSKFKLKRVGSDTKTKTVQIGLTDDINLKSNAEPKFIKEIAIPINAPKKEFTFQRINFNFSNNLSVDSIVVRLDLVTEINNLPGISLFDSPLEVVIKKENQYENIYTYDLRDLDIKYQNDFFIKVEMLTKLERPIYFSAAVLSKCLFKSTTSDIWEKTPLGITPAINADILIKK